MKNKLINFVREVRFQYHHIMFKLKIKFNKGLKEEFYAVDSLTELSDFYIKHSNSFYAMNVILSNIEISPKGKASLDWRKDHPNGANEEFDELYDTMWGVDA